MLNIYNYIESTKTLGPYNRFALWTQGCPFSCEGCMTPDSQDFNSGLNIEVNKMIELILNIGDIEGITISGGEPFAQAKELNEIIEKIKQKKDIGVIVYTGFTLSQLKYKNDIYINKFLENIDILIDGLFDSSLNDGISLRGSSNQNIYQFTQRYINVFDKYYNQSIREIEIHMKDENMMISGIPKNNTISSFVKTI